MRSLRTSLFTAAFIAALPAFAADALCPDAVSVKQAGAAPAPEWSVSYSALPNQLEMVTFYSGPPKDEASLVYDEWINAKDSSTATWKFPKDPRGYWVKCSYRGTTLELSRCCHQRCHPAESPTIARQSRRRDCPRSGASPASSATSVITIYHLERTRSERIAWLMDELGLEITESA